MSNIESKGPGRPSEFTNELGVKIVKLFKEGYSETKIAEMINVERKTIYSWRQANKEFQLDCSLAREFYEQSQVEKVELALVDRATGFRAEVKRTELHPHSGDVIELYEEKIWPPDTRAIEYYLNNRSSDRWKSKNETVLSGPDGKPLQSGPIVLINLPANGREAPPDDATTVEAANSNTTTEGSAD